MERLFLIVRLFLLMGIVLFTVLVIGGLSLYFYYSKDLPKIASLADYNPLVVSEVFSHDGTKIGEFWEEKRYLLPPEELPKGVIQAVVASEDDRFFEHEGLDYQGIIRAFIENLRAGQVVQGGSTITQQVTKALLLSKERTLKRKVKEAILATRIEHQLTKQEILYLYLNQIFFGNRAYGVEAAARNYFHKSSRELNIAEAALIAGLAKAPSTYSPISNPQRAKARQEYVIDRMHGEGYISKDEAIQAKAYPLQVYKAETDKEFNARYAPWFTETIRRFVQQKYGEQVPYTHGLKIDTTLDLSLQKAADKAVARGLRELDRRQGYQGPLRHLDDDDFNSFNLKNHLKIIREEMEEENYFDIPPEAELLSRETPLREDRLYEALIEKVDRQGQNLGVTIGNQKGIIRIHDYTWARARNLNTAGYEGVTYVSDPGGKFRMGNIVHVKKKVPTNEDLTQRGYRSDTLYFSLEQEPEVEGALFSYEIQTGFVRAIVGGKDFKKSEFNRAVQALRQTGSVFKPFVYAAALDKGYSPETIIEDAPIYYEYLPGRFWSPQNYGGGFRGPTSFRSGLVNSRNIVTVRILMDIKPDYVAGYARKLGITSPIQKYYSMALGSNDMKLFEVCRAFGAFPNGGILPELVYIRKMSDRYGRILEEHQPRQITPFSEQIKEKSTSGEEFKGPSSLNQTLIDKAQSWIQADQLELTEAEKKILYGDYIPEGYVISPRTAYSMVQLMSDIVNFGTGYKVRELKRPAAGKTGTTNDETDTWFVGYVPDLFAGVWVGFDQVKKLGGKETGGKTAAPIFLYYMQEALNGRPVAQFEIPKDIDLAALKAPLDVSPEDAEAGGIQGDPSGAEFFIYDF